MAKTPLGRLDARAFGMLELPRLAKEILEGFRALGDPRARLVGQGIKL